MRVLRGRPNSIDGDRAVSAAMLEAAARGAHLVRVWTPHRQVAFGRRDRASEGYERARSIATEAGFPPSERDVGGRAVPYDGEAILAFGLAEPVADGRTCICQRYDRVTERVRSALASLGADLAAGEPDHSVCPGSHSLSGRGKVVGVAQRIAGDAAIAGGMVFVRRPAPVLDVLEGVYDALGVPFERESVGSVAGAGGPGDPDLVRAALETGLTDGRETTVEPVEALIGG